MTWVFDSITFLTWIVLASQLMTREVEESNLENWGNSTGRQKGFRRIISALGLLPMIWYLFATHGMPYILLFQILTNAIAFQMRFFTYKIPTWILTINAIISFLPLGFANWWF
jgi:hypothetical protein